MAASRGIYPRRPLSIHSSKKMTSCSEGAASAHLLHNSVKSPAASHVFATLDPSCDAIKRLLFHRGAALCCELFFGDISANDVA